MRYFVMFTFLAFGSTASAQTLSFDGDCPGPVTIDVTGLTPGGGAAFLGGAAGEGDDVIGVGPCTGTATGLAGLRLMVRVTDMDGDGSLSFSPDIPDAMCDTPVQVLDTTTCTLSEVARASDGGGACVPSGARAPFDTQTLNTGTGCYSGSPCDHDSYSFGSGTATIFGDYGEQVTCSGAATCVGNVGITTYGSTGNCQGAFDVYCDGDWVGTIDTVGTTCSSGAMASGCDVSFEPRECSEITFETVAASEVEPTGCCGWGVYPDSVISGVSAW